MFYGRIIASIVSLGDVKFGLIYLEGAIASKKSGNLCDTLMHFRAKTIKKANIKLGCLLQSIINQEVKRIHFV